MKQLAAKWIDRAGVGPRVSALLVGAGMLCAPWSVVSAMTQPPAPPPATPPAAPPATPPAANPAAEPVERTGPPTAPKPTNNRFDDLFADPRPTVVVEGLRFAEGPLWVPAAGNKPGFLLFSDIPADTVYRLAWAGGKLPETPLKPDAGLEVFRKPSGNANGNALDAQGRVVSAQHNGQVTRRPARDGADDAVLAKEFEGNRLNSPNDLVVHTDGSIYFTDPPFGVRQQDRKLDYAGVFRLAPDGSLALLSKEINLPNGLAFAPDFKTLYVADMRGFRLMAFPVQSDGLLGAPKVFAELKAPRGTRGNIDGLRVDVDGRVYTTGPGGIWVFSAAGEYIGLVEIQGGATNVAFGGPDGKTLFITAGSRVLAINAKHAGAGVVPAAPKPTDGKPAEGK